MSHYRLLPAKPRPRDAAPDRVDWQDVVIGCVTYALLVALACMAAAAV